jgi:hypothetical protein
MTGDGHNGLVRNLGLRKLGDSEMSEIMEPQPGERTLNALNVGAAIFVSTGLRRTLQSIASRTFNRSSQIAPSCSDACLALRRIDMTMLTCWEDVVLRIDPAECLCAPAQPYDYLVDFSIIGINLWPVSVLLVRTKMGSAQEVNVAPL